MPGGTVRLASAVHAQRRRVERVSAHCGSATAKAPSNDGLRYGWSEVCRQPMAPALQRVYVMCAP